MTVRWLVAISIFLVSLLPVSAVRAQDYDDSAVDCQSRNYTYTRCDIPWPDARLVRQLSDTRCIRGQNWGVDRRGFLWVDRGCAGTIVAAGRHDHDRDRYGGEWRPEPEWVRRFTIGCSSEGYRYTFCSVDVGGGGRVYLDRQNSGSPCIEGRTWGWNRAGVWVDQGCAAVFTIDRRWR